MTAQEVLDAMLPVLARVEADPAGALRELLPLYAGDVTFQDPIQTKHGKDGFAAINERLAARSKRLAFHVRSSLAGDDQAFVTWHMELEPRFGPTLHCDGVTHLRLRDGLVVEHRDYWDLLDTVAGSLPGVATVYRALVAKLG